MKSWTKDYPKISCNSRNFQIDNVTVFNRCFMRRSSNVNVCNLYYTGWPRNNGTVDTVDFQGFALINN